MNQTVKTTYEVKEIAEILSIPLRTAYEFCKTTNYFNVIKIGRLVRIPKASFDKWFDQFNS